MMLIDMIPGDILEYIDKHWKPNQDDNYVILEKNSNDYNKLSEAFEYYFNLTPQEQEQNSFNVGPFVKICPYGKFEIDDRPNDNEFLFEYESIDRSKLQQHHLTLT